MCFLRHLKRMTIFECEFVYNRFGTALTLISVSVNSFPSCEWNLATWQGVAASKGCHMGGPPQVLASYWSMQSSKKDNT